MWGRLHSPFWAPSRRGRNKRRGGGGGGRTGYGEQYNIAASGILTRRVGVKGIDIALVQEPWYREDCIRGMNIPGYTIYYARGKERPRACILARNMIAWVRPVFSCRDLVAIPIKYIEDGAQRRLVVCSAYLPYDSEDPAPKREMVELVRYCEN